MGGWAADAVLGVQTRDHVDLDVLFEAEPNAEQRAFEALSELGFQLVRREQIPGWLPTRIVFSDGGGHLVDLHPVTFPGGRVVARTADGETVTLDHADAFTGGTVAGQPVRCLSARLQIAVRSGYEIREIDRRDVERLCATAGLPVPPDYRKPAAAVPPSSPRRWRARLRRLRPPRAESALIVPVEAAEPAVEEWRRRHDPSAAHGMPAHVTVLYPFLRPAVLDESIEQELRSLLSTFPGFRFELSRVDRFPGVLYLAPEPPLPFAELTEMLWRRWPDCPPYGGAYDAIVPHLTVVQGTEPPGLDRELAGRLPLGATATEVRLMTRDGGPWSVKARFPLSSK